MGNLGKENCSCTVVLFNEIALKFTCRVLFVGRVINTAWVPNLIKEIKVYSGINILDRKEGRQR